MTTNLAARISWILLLLLAGCAALPPSPASSGPDLSLTHWSPHRHFLITLIPPANIPVQEIHSWQVKVETPDGKPLTKALVYMNGGMPEHGHGLPTRPVVTGEIAEGIYRVEGVKFSMAGWWEILVAVQKGPASDVTSFNQIIALPVPLPPPSTTRDR